MTKKFPLDTTAITNYVKDTLMGYLGDGLENFPDTLLEPENEGFCLHRTGGWGLSYGVEAASSLVGDTLKVSMTFEELDEEGEPVGTKEYELTFTLRLVQVGIEDLP